jgi:outer membrane lipoprotein SlyB
LRPVTIEGTQHGAGTAAGVAATAQGVEITVQLDSGRTLVVVQEGPVDAFRPGDRIRVLADGYTTRVSR